MEECTCVAVSRTRVAAVYGSSTGVGLSVSGTATHAELEVAVGKVRPELFS